jgi:hypothetical protein
MHPLLPPECKFAVLALSNMRVDFPDALSLPDGIAALQKFPIDLDPNWQNWLGLDMPRVADANFILVCTARDGFPPGSLGISDATNLALSNRLVEVFVMLRLMGTVEYESAFFLTGFSRHDKTVCQSYSTLARFHITRGCLPWMPTPRDLEAAVRLAVAKESFLSQFPDRHRVRIFRGWVSLSAGLQQYYASDRIHAFVRALEALIHPRIGKTAHQFAERCSILAAPNERRTAVREVLREAYAMRCDVEHVNDWDQSLAKYDIEDRENIAFWRTRQMETLVCSSYARIFGSPELQRSFSTDHDIAMFWRKPEREIRRLFGESIDITELKNVTKYDAAGRANVLEWPSGWIEKLTRIHRGD